MELLLKKTIDHLPAILVKNAPSMMQRMLAAMRYAIAQDSQLANGAYSTLLLKVSEPELIREFTVSIKNTVASAQLEASLFEDSLSMSLEPLEVTATNFADDFLTSTVAFDSLSDHAKKLGVTGLNLYKKELFLAVLKDTFIQAKMDVQEVNKIMPHARKALNVELRNVYEKLHAVQKTVSMDS